MLPVMETGAFFLHRNVDTDTRKNLETHSPESATNVQSKRNAVKKATVSKQRSHSETTADGSQDSEQEKQHMQEQNEEKQNASLSVREVVSTYVHSRKWDTLVGKAYHMGSEESREEFIDFLTTHINRIMECGMRMKGRQEATKKAS